MPSNMPGVFTVALLADQPPTLDSQNVTRDNLFHLAAYFGLTEFVSTVLEQDHVVNIRDTIGNPPLI